MNFRALNDHSWLPAGRTSAEIITANRVTRDIVSVLLRPSRRWRGFRAGQHVRLTVDTGGVRRARCCPVTSSQHRADGRIELAVRARPHGAFADRVRRAGTIVGLSAARGSFTLPVLRAGKLVLIGQGIGVGPVLSMMRTLADECHTGEVAVLSCAGREEDVPYHGELAELAGTCPGFQVSRGGRGRFEHRHLTAVAPWYAEAETYLWGDHELTRTVRAWYRTAALAHRLHVGEPSVTVTRRTGR